MVSIKRFAEIHKVPYITDADEPIITLSLNTKTAWIIVNADDTATYSFDTNAVINFRDIFALMKRLKQDFRIQTSY